MSVFINQQGKFYQAEKAFDAGDAKVEHPTALQLEYLTETPVTEPEFGVGVRKAEVAKLQPVVEAIVEEKTSDPKKGNGSGVTDTDLKTL